MSLNALSRLLATIVVGASAWLPGRHNPRIASRAPASQGCGGQTAEGCLVPGKYAMVSAGHSHSCAISVGGETYCWGDGRSGALGYGNLETRRSPARVAGSSRFVEVRAGDDYSCGRTAAGEIFCWGKAQTVPGYPALSAVPVRVPLTARAVRLTAGEHHACVIADGGDAYCWGRNIEGQNGNGTRGVSASVTPVPTRVAGGLHFSAISAGLDFTCALTTDGAPYCWGSNVDGVSGSDSRERCGDVSVVPCASTPARVQTTATFVDISSGNGHACARTRQAALFCWGSNALGQIGARGRDGRGEVGVPRRVVIEDVTGFAAIAAGGARSCALTLTGAAYCWGADSNARVGAELSPSRIVPAAVQTRHAFISLSVGQNHACGIDPSGGLLCWGDNQSGALGVPQ